MPFGGVGASGFGVYHGPHSFDTFSHQKSVLIRGFNPILEWVASKRYPPYTENHLKRLLRIIRKRKSYIPKNLSSMFVFGMGFAACYFYLNALHALGYDAI